jgi:pimeloyl-ACP methyl ester carboxylesterase
MAFAYRFESAEILSSSMTFLDLGIGEAVLLGHSYLWDAEMWRPQIEGLARHYRVIVPNLWGHGGSGRLPAGTKDLREIAQHHLALMNMLGVDRFAVLGLSSGGMWGAELAIMAPRRVTALGLLDTFLGPEPQISRDRYFGMLDAIAAAKSVPEPMLDLIVPLFFAPSTASKMPALPAAFRVKLRNWDSDRLLDSVLPIGRMVFGRRDARSDLRDLPMPKLVLTGSEDIPRPAHEGQQMATILNCPFIEIRDAGHVSTLDAAEPVTAHLVRFLADALGRGTAADRSAV